MIYRTNKKSLTIQKKEVYVEEFSAKLIKRVGYSRQHKMEYNLFTPERKLKVGTLTLNSIELTSYGEKLFKFNEFFIDLVNECKKQLSPCWGYIPPDEKENEETEEEIEEFEEADLEKIKEVQNDKVKVISYNDKEIDLTKFEKKEISKEKFFNKEIKPNSLYLKEEIRLQREAWKAQQQAKTQ